MIYNALLVLVAFTPLLIALGFARAQRRDGLGWKGPGA